MLHEALYWSALQSLSEKVIRKAHHVQECWPYLSDMSEINAVYSGRLPVWTQICCYGCLSGLCNLICCHPWLQTQPTHHCLKFGISIGVWWPGSSSPLHTRCIAISMY